MGMDLNVFDVSDFRNPLDHALDHFRTAWLVGVSQIEYVQVETIVAKSITNHFSVAFDCLLERRTRNKAAPCLLFFEYATGVPGSVQLVQ